MPDYRAVITGGTRGIGLGIAESLARRNASLALTYLGDERAARAAEARLRPLLAPGRGLMILKGDGSDHATARAQFAAIGERLGPVNVLVNNAGRMPARGFGELSFAEWDRTIRVNLSSAFYWSSLAVPAMREQGFGRIVNLSSIAARGGGVIGPHYAASKAGMVGLTRYAARELSPLGITVNAIAPAFIEDAGVFVAWDQGRKAELKKKVFTPRLGLVADVARAFEYLLESPYVTGVTLDVNGGAFMI